MVEPTSRHTNLLPQHQALLDASAISLEVADARGYRSIGRAEARELGFAQPRPGLLIPLWRVDGETGGYQLRPDEPRVVSGKALKYESVKAQRNVLDVPPTVREELGKGREAILVTEGARKADALASLGIPAINLAGVYGWRGKNKDGGITALPDWESVAIKGNIFVLAFDSDILTKPNVHQALARLKRWLEHKGAARVRLLVLPESSHGKTGVDDYIHETGATAEDLARLVVDDLPALGGPEFGHGPDAIPGPRTPLLVARKYVEDDHTAGGQRTLIDYKGELMSWDGAAYRTIETGWMRSRLYEWLSSKTYLEENSDGNEAIKPWNPTPRSVSDVLDALRAVVHLDGQIAPPAWLPGGASGRGCLPMANGALTLESRELREPSPSLFTTFSLPYDYVPDAGPPVAWLAFLESIWGDDDQQIAALQEWMGYILSGETNQQKIALLYGPTRSGKSTIARILTALVGLENVAAPTLNGLSTNFGLQSLLGKPLGIIADARLSGRGDAQVIAERLLSISGEDLQTIPRKYLPDWTGKLPTRLMLLTNELPRIADASGALAGRFLALRTTHSFYDREDTTLASRLSDELPSILLWALDGWNRLMARGHFTQPTASRDSVSQMMDMASPVSSFVQERCVLTASAVVAADDLYWAFYAWSDNEGTHFISDKVTFGRDLSAAFPEIGRKQIRIGGKHVWHYTGIGFRDPDSGELSPDVTGYTLNLTPTRWEKGWYRSKSSSSNNRDVTSYNSLHPSKWDPKRQPTFTCAPRGVPCETPGLCDGPVVSCRAFLKSAHG